MTESSDRGAAAGAPGGSNSAGGGHDRPIVDLDFLRGLIGAVDESGIDSLEISRGGTRIRISKTPPPAPVGGMIQAAAPMQAAAPAAPPAASAPSAPTAGGGAGGGAAAEAARPKNNWVEVKSPMVGTFYRAPAPEAPPYVEVGSRVSRGQTLSLIHI